MIFKADFKCWVGDVDIVWLGVGLPEHVQVIQYVLLCQGLIPNAILLVHCSTNTNLPHQFVPNTIHSPPPPNISSNYPISQIIVCSVHNWTYICAKPSWICNMENMENWARKSHHNCAVYELHLLTFNCGMAINYLHLYLYNVILLCWNLRAVNAFHSVGNRKSCVFLIVQFWDAG